MYIGYLSAEEILEIAEVPCYNENTQNFEIATHAVTPPVKEWQRPLSLERVGEIAARFDNSGEFMPNPVLLCENVTINPSPIRYVPHTLYGNTPTGFVEVHVPISVQGQPKPLWILDGQHRINGLGRSAQNHDKIPVVMLLDRASGFYTGSVLAKIFAQVTTTAKKLDPLHNEWLTFAFNLDTYDPTGANFSAHKASMACVADLCKVPSVGAGNHIPNPFHNRVQFSQYKPGGPARGGFVYTCQTLKNIVFDSYYNVARQATLLPPGEVASEIALAYHALTNVVNLPQRSVFFGTTEGQAIMQEAFIVGVLSYLGQFGHPSSNLQVDGTPVTWEYILKKLNFHQTDWNFAAWIVSLSGTVNTMSKKLAIAAFINSFRTLAIPLGCADLADFLRGSLASITLEFSELTAAGGISSRNRIEQTYVRGAGTSVTLPTQKHVRIKRHSTNIGSVEVEVRIANTYVPFEGFASRGFELQTTLHANPLMLKFTFHHYGDNKSAVDLVINW